MKNITFIEWMALAAIGGMFAAMLIQPYDDTDDRQNKERSGMNLYIDNKTGCEYLGVPIGSITPRLDRNGDQLGCK